MAHEKLIRLLNFLWLLLVFPGAVAVLVGFLSHSPTLGIKTFLLIEVGIAILSLMDNQMGVIANNRTAIFGSRGG